MPSTISYIAHSPEKCPILVYNNLDATKEQTHKLNVHRSFTLSEAALSRPLMGLNVRINFHFDEGYNLHINKTGFCKPLALVSKTQN